MAKVDRDELRKAVREELYEDRMRRFSQMRRRMEPHTYDCTCPLCRKANEEFR